MGKSGKIVMLFFIFSEAFFFIALIIAYVYYRNFSHATDTVAQSLDTVRTGIFTLCLISSSFTLIFSKKALQSRNNKLYKILMAATILLGIVFMAGQITEYAGLYHEEITMHSDIFGSSFFTLTGFHGLHVVLGLVALSIFFGMSFGPYEIVSEAGFDGLDIYWHFVDVVWLFVFFFVYITPLL